jgi:glycerophosphoryl diester phosphodiesterase
VPIGFAHRGARAHAPENTLDAFTLAARLGATGLETDAWLSADGEVVLDHDGVFRSGMRKRRIAEVPRSALPGHIPTLADLYAACGTSLPLSIDVKDPSAAEPIVAMATEAGAAGALHLCSPSLDELVSWRKLSDDVQLVHSTRLRRLKDGAERHAAQLSDAGIDVVNMHWEDWSGGLIALYHRFDRRAFGWDAQHRRQLDALLAMKIDAVYSDHVERMMDAIERRPERLV